MLKQLKRRLIFMYGVSSSLILTIIIILVFYINTHEHRRSEIEALENDITSYAQNIEKSEYISTTWISQIESKHNFLIRIEDNNINLEIRNTVETLEDSSSLFDNLKEEVKNKDPFFFDVIQYNEIKLSKTYDLFRYRNESYRGIVVNVPVKKGIRTLYFIQVIDNSYMKLFQQGMYLFLLDLLGIILLFAVSHLYIIKVLTPLNVGNAQQKEFIASVSHELRSPLTVIKAGISSIKTELSNEHLQEENIIKAKHYIFPIESECIRMNRLINDMLLLSAAEQGSWTIVKESVDLETLLIDIYDMFCILHSEDIRIIDIDLSNEPLQRICGDSERLKQVCMIILDNALSYTPANQNITIRAYNNKTVVCIEVQDHGEGMQEEEKQRVFDAFYRKESSRYDKNHFGLGLSIAKKIIDLHNGTILIKDTIGGGTTFCICLNVEKTVDKYKKEIDL